MPNIENIKKSVKYQTLASIVGKKPKTVKSYFNFYKMDVENIKDLKIYIDKFYKK